MEDISFEETSLNMNPRSSKKFPSRFFILVIVVIILALIVFGISQLFFAKSSPKKEPSVKTTITLAPTNPPEVSKAAETTPTKSPNTTPTPKPGASSLDKTKVTIEIQNGSGAPGVASKMATFLKDLGYTVGSTGNADNYEYTGVTIQTKAEFKDYITTLKKDLTPDYIVSSSTSDLSSTSTADILVIVGK